MKTFKSTVTKKALSLILALSMLLGGISTGMLMSASAADNSGGVVNPTPDIDIAVNVPSDYPGTFLDFKKEMTDKLNEELDKKFPFKNHTEDAEGNKRPSFRITNTAVSIDTTDLNGWYVYDHYRDQAAYNALNLSAAQKKIQPYRAADNSSASNNRPISDAKNTNFGSCQLFDRHIYSYSENGKQNMVFTGYGTMDYVDYMLYPAASEARRTVSFDIDANAIGNHTLQHYGFLINAGIDNSGNLIGYVLTLNPSHTGGIRKITGIDAANMCAHQTNPKLEQFGIISGSGVTVSLNSTKKARLTVEINKDKITVQSQPYNTDGTLGNITTHLRDFKIDDTGYNGFGPIVAYQHHGCSQLTTFRYLDLEMSYEATAFDALKKVQYNQTAEQKYFINLVGASNDPGIPNEYPDKVEIGDDGNAIRNESYQDGINRLNQNEIFYLSNGNDGLIITDSNDNTADPTKPHLGLGANNGRTSFDPDNYIQEMAEYIAGKYNEPFDRSTYKSTVPLANFYIKDPASGNQIMTIHLQHLANGKDGAATSQKVGITDKSMASDGNTIRKWVLKVTGPAGVTPVEKTFNTKQELEAYEYEFTANSIEGTYDFSLEIEGTSGKKSTFITYVTAFKDTEAPMDIEGANTSRNVATITLTDKGSGIDEDGITFIKDNRGSGVAAYYVTNDNSFTPTAIFEDWEFVEGNPHSYQFELEIEDTKPIIIWTMDECGNIGSKAVFQPTRVIVKDGPGGNEIDDYYVIGEKPIIVLPEPGSEDVPDVKPDDKGEDEHFSGWKIDDEDKPDITPGTEPETKDDHTIVIIPDYTKEKAILVYNLNGGTVNGSNAEINKEVFAGSSVYKLVSDHDIIPKQPGKVFTGWTLNQDGTGKIDTAVMPKKGNPETPAAENSLTIYAQWEDAKYTIRFDANGGSLGKLRSVENVGYQAVINSYMKLEGEDGTYIPYTGRNIPSKPGYIFKGWSLSKDNDLNKRIITEAGQKIGTDAMPDNDVTIYAVWQKDNSKYTISFDTLGGNRINDQAYTANPTENYRTAPTPVRTGYEFDGWFESPDNTDAPYPATTVKVTADKTYYAHWTAKNDTVYTVEYYINSGIYDGENGFVYTKIKQSRTFTGTTGETAEVPEEAKIAEIEVDGVKYWYNADVSAAKGALSGTVTGSPTLALKLFYDSYCSVTETHKGNGTVDVSKATDVKLGSEATVTWKPDDDNKVIRVIVDGVVRDDLLNETSFTFDDGAVKKNHTVYVEFKETKAVIEGPTIKKSQFTVRTTVLGCSNPDMYKVTPTASYDAGRDASVVWQYIESTYKIAKLWVDGVEYEVPENRTVEFKNLSADHSVVILLESLPSVGGQTTEGKYTVTVNKYGGDEYCWVSDSVVVNAGESATVQWDADHKNGDEDLARPEGQKQYKVYKVCLDGKEYMTGAIKSKYKTSKKPLNSVKANHVIDIYFAEVDEETGTVIPPTFEDTDDTKYLQLTTQLIGAPGTITGGAIVEKKADEELNRDIDWEVNAPMDADPSSDEYVYYAIDKIEVNGESRYSTDEDGNVIDSEGNVIVEAGGDKLVSANDEGLDDIKKVILKDITVDTDVKVYVKPVTHTVTIRKFGQGTVDPSKVVYHLANYNDLKAIPAEDWSTAKIVVNGEDYWNFENQPEQSSLRKAVRRLFSARSNDAPTSITSETLEGITEDQVIDVYFTKNDDHGNPTPAPTADEIKSVNVSIESADGLKIGKVTAGNVLLADDETETSVNWELPENYEVVEILVNDEKLTKIVTNGDKTETVDVLDPFTLNDITEKENNVVIKVRLKDNDKVPGSTFREVTHMISGFIKGDDGQIYYVNRAVADGDDKTVYWTLPEDQEVKYVFIDGVAVEDLKSAKSKDEGFTFNFVDEEGKTLTKPDDGRKGNSYTFENVTEDHTIVVVIGKPDETPVNIDKDDDGIPDINIDKDDPDPDPDKPRKPDVNVDTDGDGEPDVNIDTDGDGEPDINIVDKDGDGEPDKDIEPDPENPPKPDVNVDTDDDGKPDVNVDTDDDGKPDINIVDKDGDGEPDKDIDPENPPKPDVNVDTDDDGKPDVNVDTDDDGKPDINIVDKDDDGKPDKDIDPENPPKPDVNVDTDDDGKPDVNVDTDDDGKPDINIVDKDDDGKPDKDIDNSDPKNPVLPDVNVDTDGDGKPDVNIDKDGDGKPDINIVDKDKDGKPDKGIDNRDPKNPVKPDVNIDIDGDGIPDLNIDTDGDGIPDKNIDADGDGVVDGIATTGDNRPIVPFIFMMVLSLAVIATTVVIKKRQIKAE